MFSGLASFFSPTKIFQGLHHTILEGFDLNVALDTPKTVNQAAFDKDFWAAHYAAVIEELEEGLSQGVITQEIFKKLEERLIECQDMIGRYTLSPEFYGEGIQHLIKIFPDSTQEDEHLSYLAILEGIHSDFQQTLIEQRDFTRECFIGDVNHLLGEWRERKIRSPDFKQAIAYYENVMVMADYYDALFNLEHHLQKISKVDSLLLEEVQQLLTAFNPIEVQKSRCLLRNQILLSEQVQQAESDTMENLDIASTVSASSLLTRFFEVFSDACHFIATHPLETMTLGLAAQSAAVAALSNSPSPTASPSTLAEFQINTYTTGDQINPSVTGLVDGGFVVAWQSNGQDGIGWGIYGQRYNVTGCSS